MLKCKPPDSCQISRVNKTTEQQNLKGVLCFILYEPISATKRGVWGCWEGSCLAGFFASFNKRINNISLVNMNQKPAKHTSTFMYLHYHTHTHEPFKFDINKQNWQKGFQVKALVF